MKIVSKEELINMPQGTPFRRYHSRESWPCSFDIFVDACGYIDDFLYRSTDNPEWGGSEQLFARRHEMDEQQVSYPVDLRVDREQLYDPETRYLIWEPDDVRRIIALLQGADVDERDDRD